jgi:hypothetical protein
VRAAETKVTDMTSSPSDPWSIPEPEPAAPEPSTQPMVPPPSQPGQAGPGQATPQPYSGQPSSGQPFSGQQQTAPWPASSALEPVVPSQPGPVIVQIAEIAVTSTTIYTPTGDIPLAGSQWTVNDYWYSHQRTPRWAIVAAIAGFCVLTVFSLFFLLVKETVTEGTVQITVTNGTRQYAARIPVRDQGQVTTLNQQVNYVRSLAAL